MSEGINNMSFYIMLERALNDAVFKYTVENLSGNEYMFHITTNSGMFSIAIKCQYIEYSQGGYNAGVRTILPYDMITEVTMSTGIQETHTDVLVWFKVAHQLVGTVHLRGSVTRY